MLAREALCSYRLVEAEMQRGKWQHTDLSETYLSREVVYLRWYLGKRVATAEAVRSQLPGLIASHSHDRDEAPSESFLVDTMTFDLSHQMQAEEIQELYNKYAAYLNSMAVP